MWMVLKEISKISWLKNCIFFSSKNLFIFINILTLAVECFIKRKIAYDIKKFWPDFLCTHLKCLCVNKEFIYFISITIIKTRISYNSETCLNYLQKKNNFLVNPNNFQ